MTQPLPKWPSTQTALDGWIHIAKTTNGFLQRGLSSFCKGYVVGKGEHPDGVYVRWQGNGQSLRAQTCDTGFIPCFWYADNEQVVLSTKLDDLLLNAKIQPRPDVDALGVFFRLGFFLGETTPFKKVGILGPAETLTWQNGVVNIQSRKTNTTLYRGSRKSAMRMYADLFHQSVKDICIVEKGPIWLPLSGGRDSRHIAVELNRLSKIPIGVVTAEHLPGRSNDDLEIARKLALDLGWKHRVAKQGNRFLSEQRIARITDFLSYEHSWTITIADELERAEAKSVFDGVGGDVLSAGLYQDTEDFEALEKGGTSALARRILQKWSWLGNVTKNFDAFGPALDGIWDEESARVGIENELAKHMSSINPVKEFYFWNRSRRGTGLLPYKIMGKFRAYTPYLSLELQNFLRSLPHEMTADKKFHSDTIELIDPIVGKVRYATDVNKIKDSWLSPRLFATSLLRKVLANSHQEIWKSRALYIPILKSFLTGWRNLSGWNPKRIIYLSEFAEFVTKLNKSLSCKN